MNDLVDRDFRRGETVWERFYTKDRALGTVEQGPFYAAPFLYVSLGTKGGPRTNRYGQVLRADRSVMEDRIEARTVRRVVGFARPHCSLIAVFLDGGVIGRPHEPAFILRFREQVLVINVKSEISRRFVKIGAVNKECRLFLLAQAHEFVHNRLGFSVT